MGSEHGPSGVPADGDNADEVIVDISAAEAAGGTMRAVAVPAGDTITVQLPPGLADGTLIRLTGAGRPDPSGKPGDLLLRVRIQAGGSQAGGSQAGGASPAGPAGPFAAGPATGGPTTGGPAVPPPFGPPVPVGGFPPPGPGQPGATQAFPAHPPGGFPPGGFPQGGYQPGGFPQGGFPPGGYPPPPVRPSGRRGRLIAAVAGGATLVVLLGCCGAGWLVTRDDDSPPGSSGPNGVAPSPTAPPLSPEAYQAALASADTKLTAGVRGLVRAGTPKAAAQAAATLATTAATAGDELAAAAPPEPVADAHDALVAALEDLSVAAGQTQAAARDLQVCAGSSAAALLSRSTAVDDLYAAAARLGTADPGRAYTFGAAMPRDNADTNRRAGNGAYVKRTRGGSGELRITNGGSADAVISLVGRGSRAAATTVYVRGKGKHTVTGVRDGTYQVFMSSGVDWDTRGKRFTRDCGFSRFDETFKFTTTSTQYTIWEVSLTPVVGGNATTTDVDPDTFPTS